MQSRLLVSRQHQNENEWREGGHYSLFSQFRRKQVIYRKNHELFGKIHDDRQVARMAAHVIAGSAVYVCVVLGSQSEFCVRYGDFK